MQAAQTASAFDVTTLVKALHEASGFIARILKEEQGVTVIRPAGWQVDPQAPSGVQERQRGFLERFQAISGELNEFDELQAWARWEADELNNILADHGFSIRLDPWPDDRRTFGVVAIYDLVVKWFLKGEIGHFVAGMPDRPAYRLSRKNHGVHFYKVDGSEPLIVIPGQRQGDYVAVIKHPQLEGFQLLSKVEELRQVLKTEYPRNDYDGVIMPNVLFNQEVDISWLQGMWKSESEDRLGWAWRVSQAKMQAKFALGPEGARAKVASAAGIMRTLSIEMPQPDYQLNGDFIVFFGRRSVPSEPLFSAWIPKEEFARRTVGLDEI